MSQDGRRVRFTLIAGSIVYDVISRGIFRYRFNRELDRNYPSAPPILRDRAKDRSVSPMFTSSARCSLSNVYFALKSLSASKILGIFVCKAFSIRPGNIPR